MGTVNCCEQPKETLQTEEIETHLTNPDPSKANLIKTPIPNEDTLKPKMFYDKKTERIIKIQSIMKRFLSKLKFNRRVGLQKLALKEYFRTQGVLCEKDNVDIYIHPIVKKIESQIIKKEGIYNNPNIPNNILEDISYQPFYSLEMPCTYLIENKEENNLYNKSYFENKETTNNSTPNNEFESNLIRKSVYKGHWSLDKKKYGYGILINSEGSKYEGLFRNGKLDGRGRYITIKGDFFDGNFSNGSTNGFGIFIHPDGSIYKGNWMNDLPWGEGEEWSSDGSYYKGDFFQGKKFGIGEFKWKDGAIYLGGIKNDLLNGDGIYTWSDGRRYKGFWQENNMHGYGVLENPDGTKYEGYFEINKKHGKGKYWYNKEKYYEGQWINGKQNGKGKIVKNGIVEEGLWVDGKKIKS